MPTFTFTDPSGKKHSVTGPEGATQEEAFSILKQSMKPAPDESLLGKITSGAKAIATGGLEGALGSTLALPKNLMDLANVGVSKALGIPVTPIPDAPKLPGTDVPIVPSSQDFTSALQRQGLYHEAASPTERFLQAGAAGVGSMINPLNPLKYTKAMAAMGAGSGLGGELADKLEGGDQPWARLFGSAVGLAPGALAFKTPQVVKAVQGTIGDIGIPGLTAADVAAKGAGETLGVPSLLAHQLPEGSPLAQLVAAVARQPEGGAIRRVVSGEQAAMEQKARELAAGLSPSDLGSEAENAVQRAGVAATYKAPADIRRSITDPLYTASTQSETVPDISNIIESITNLQKARNAIGGHAGGAIDTATSQLLDLFSKFPEGQVPATAIETLGSGFKDIGRRTAPELTAAEQARGYRVAGEAVTGALSPDLYPKLGVARQAYLDISKNLNDPIRQGILGKVFPDERAVTGSFPQQKGILDAARFNATDVADAAQRITRQDPTAFPIIMKKAATDALEKADGSMPAFVKNFAGGEKQRANTLEGINQTALAHGFSPEEAQAAAAGADNLLTVLSTVGEGGARIGGVDTSSLLTKAGQTGISSSLRAIPSLFKGIPDAIDAVVRGHTISKLADIFTSPDQLSELAKIAAYSPTENAAEILTRGLSSLTAQQGAAPTPTE